MKFERKEKTFKEHLVQFFFVSFKNENAWKKKTKNKDEQN